jgi:hypothetical protein
VNFGERERGRPACSYNPKETALLKHVLLVHAALCVGAALAGSASAAPAGSAGHGSASITACSLVTAPKAAKILGYPVRLSKGETAQDCNIIATPIKIRDGHTFHPTTIVEVDPSNPTLYKQLATGKGSHPLAGLGSRAFISYNPSINGFYIGAEVHGMLLQVSVGDAIKPITHAQGITLAKLIASRI